MADSAIPQRPADGCFELYKTTAGHDGDEGRKQHGFPRAKRRRSEARYLWHDHFGKARSRSVW